MENGLKEALKYAVDLAEPAIFDFDFGTYSDKGLQRVTAPKTETLNVTTLTALVEYVKQNKDALPLTDLTVHVVSPTEVQLLSRLVDAQTRRERYVSAKPELPFIQFGNLYNNENFNILMQSAFQDTEDKKIILKVVGNIIDKAVRQTSDDGVTQAVTIKTGVTNVDNVVVPNPVTLKPYRTFTEVEQPESKFIFRMREGGNCMLVEADGGAWKRDAMENIKGFLTAQLPEISIIS